jgi:hypothetical protein
MLFGRVRAYDSAPGAIDYAAGTATSFPWRSDVDVCAEPSTFVGEVMIHLWAGPLLFAATRCGGKAAIVASHQQDLEASSIRSGTCRTRRSARNQQLMRRQPRAAPRPIPPAASNRDPPLPPPVGQVLGRRRGRRAAEHPIRTRHYRIPPSRVRWATSPRWPRSPPSSGTLDQMRSGDAGRGRDADSCSLSPTASDKSRDRSRPPADRGGRAPVPDHSGGMTPTEGDADPDRVQSRSGDVLPAGHCCTRSFQRSQGSGRAARPPERSGG